MSKYDMFKDTAGFTPHQMAYFIGGVLQRLEIKGVVRKKDVKELAEKAKNYKLRI